MTCLCKFVGLLLLMVSGIAAQQQSCSEWTYTDQDNWPESHCTGNRQSPIDINPSRALFNPTFSPLAIDTASSGVSTILSNDGHHIVIRANGLEVLGFLSGGPLFNDATLYGIVEARFHFGVVVNGNAMSGSDHLVGGRSFAGELQYIAYNTMYPSYQVALTQPQGIAIVSVLFEQKSDVSNNVDLNMFLDTVSSEVRYRGNDFALDGLDLRQLLPASISDYYAYSGSFSWPRCSTNVTWIVMADTLPVTADQLNSLQSVFTSRRGQNPSLPMAGNTRQTQEVNGRSVVASFPTGQAVALGCNHEGDQIPLGQTKEIHVTDDSDTRSARSGNDIIFLVDQSGSARIRRLHSWLKGYDFAVKLDTALSDNGFNRNRFGLVGFGHDTGGQASTIEVGEGGQLLGTSADLQRAFTSLISRGSREDGYAGIQLALRAYDMRPQSHCMIVLLTDEGRDALAAGLNRDLLEAELGAKQCTLNVIVHEHFGAGMRPDCRRRRSHRQAFGMDSQSHSIIKHPGAEFEVVPWAGYARRGSANKNTHQAYVELAWATGGTAFDVKQITDISSSSRVAAADALSNMLAQLRLRDLQRYTCKRCTCTLASTVDCRRCDADFPPQAVVVADPATVFLGESGKLHCVASGHPVPTVAWQRTDGSASLPPGVSVDGSELSIRSITERNCYTCVANAGRLGESMATGCVEVQGVIPVPLVSQPPPINAGAGARFTCLSSGYPEPQIDWVVDSPACAIDGNMVTCSNLQQRVCVTCNSQNRLGAGSDTACVDVYAGCEDGARHNSHRRRFTPDASIPADNMHMVVLFDESRTMVEERTALPAIINNINAALIQDGFGVRVENKFSLVAFAGSLGAQGRFITVGSGVCGSATELGAASASLLSDGRTEDGYSAMHVALEGATRCDAGPNSQLVLFLLTDEDRDTLRGFGEQLTYDTTLSSLRTANARFSAAVKQQYRAPGGQAFGLDSKSRAFVITDGGQSFELAPNGAPIRDSGFGTTEQDYVDLARATGGAFFNVESITASGGARLPGFTAALAFSLTEQLADERVRPLCQECLCNDSRSDCTNLPHITDRAACVAPSDVALGVSVRSDPVFGMPDREMTLFCDSDDASAVTQWQPHPVDAFQTGSNLHFPTYTASNQVTYTCTQRTPAGGDSDLLSIDVVPPLQR